MTIYVISKKEVCYKGLYCTVLAVESLWRDIEYVQTHPSQYWLPVL